MHLATNCIPVARRTSSKGGVYQVPPAWQCSRFPVIFHKTPRECPPLSAKLSLTAPRTLILTAGPPASLTFRQGWNKDVLPLLSQHFPQPTPNRPRRAKFSVQQRTTTVLFIDLTNSISLLPVVNLYPLSTIFNCTSTWRWQKDILWTQTSHKYTNSGITLYSQWSLEYISKRDLNGYLIFVRRLFTFMCYIVHRTTLQQFATKSYQNTMLAI